MTYSRNHNLKKKEFFHSRSNYVYYDIFIVITVILSCVRACGQDFDAPMVLSNKQDEARLEAVAHEESIAAKYPEWYKLVTQAVEIADERGSAIDCFPLLRMLILPFYENLSKCTVDIYDFLKRLERNEAGRRFIEALKKQSEYLEFSIYNQAGKVGWFIGTMFNGEVILGVEGVQEYQPRFCLNFSSVYSLT